MKKQNIIIGLVAAIALVGLSGYLYNQNQLLKAQMAASDEKYELKLEKLEKKLEETKKPSPTLPSDDELMANLFPEIAALEEEAKEIVEEKSPGYLSVTPEVLDLGTVSKAAGPKVATYTIKNNGNKVLTLSYAFASCGCTTSSLKEDVDLAPGESLPLEVEYDPNFYGPSYELGDITKTVTVLSNDPVRPFYKVSLKANVTP